MRATQSSKPLLPVELKPLRKENQSLSQASISLSFYPDNMVLPLLLLFKLLLLLLGLSRRTTNDYRLRKEILSSRYVS